MQKKMHTSFNLNKLFPKLLLLILIAVIGHIIFSFFTSEKMILSSITNFSYGYLSFAILLTLIPWLTHSLRLLIWTQFLDERLSFTDIFKIVLATDLAAAISPTSMGGAPVKAGMMMHRGVHSGVAVSLTALGSIEDYLFSIIAIPAGLFITSSWNLPIFKTLLQKIWQPAIWVLISVVVIILAGRNILKLVRKIKPGVDSNLIITPLLVRKIKMKIKNFWTDFKSVYYLIGKRGKSRFVVSMVLTSIQWICRYSVTTALIASLGIHVEPVLFFVLQWIVFTLMIFVPTPGAAAGAEAAFYLIFHSFIPGEAIGLVTIGWRFLTFYLLVVLGILIFLLLNIPHHFVQRLFKRPIVQPLSISME